MSYPEFPRLLLREKSHSWNLGGVTTAGGITGNSVMPIGRTDGGGFWIASMSDVSLSGGRAGAVGRDRQREATLLWRAIRQLANGGVGPLVVPRNDALFRPWPAGVSKTPPIVTHSDLTLFSDDSSYYQPVIDVTCAAADLRATSLDLTLNQCGDLLGGESFSIEHDDETIGWRIYEIGTVVYSDATHATITFNPPLRDDVKAGTAVEFDRPRCLMRLAKPSSMDLAVAPWTFNQASVDFIEAFP